MFFLNTRQFFVVTEDLNEKLRINKSKYGSHFKFESRMYNNSGISYLSQRQASRILVSLIPLVNVKMLIRQEPISIELL